MLGVTMPLYNTPREELSWLKRRSIYGLVKGTKERNKTLDWVHSEKLALRQALWWQVFCDEELRVRLPGHILCDFRRARVLADPAAVLLRAVLHHDEAPGQAHDEAQVHPLRPRQKGAFLACESPSKASNLLPVPLLPDYHIF